MSFCGTLERGEFERGGVGGDQDAVSCDGPLLSVVIHDDFGWTTKSNFKNTCMGKDGARFFRGSREARDYFSRIDGASGNLVHRA